MRECPLEREMDEGRLDGKAGVQFSGQQVRDRRKKGPLLAALPSSHVRLRRFMGFHIASGETK